MYQVLNGENVFNKQKVDNKLREINRKNKANDIQFNPGACVYRNGIYCVSF